MEAADPERRVTLSQQIRDYAAAHPKASHAWIAAHFSRTMSKRVEVAYVRQALGTKRCVP